MRIINRLRNPGEIRSVRLEPEKVTVRLVDDEVIMYERVEDKSEQGTKHAEFLERRRRELK